MQLHAVDPVGEAKGCAMGTQDLGSGSVTHSWHPSSIVYSRSYLSAALRAGAIAFLLLLALLLVIIF